MLAAEGTHCHRATMPHDSLRRVGQTIPQTTPAVAEFAVFIAQSQIRMKTADGAEEVGWHSQVIRGQELHGRESARVEFVWVIAQQVALAMIEVARAAVHRLARHRFHGACLQSCY